MSEELHSAQVCIGPDHPALAGHFPDAPVVPGVLLLDEVLRVAEICRGERLSVHMLQQAKFPSSLLPAQEARVELRFVRSELRFTVSRESVTIAQGVFTLAQSCVSES